MGQSSSTCEQGIAFEDLMEIRTTTLGSLNEAEEAAPNRRLLTHSLEIWQYPSMLEPYRLELVRV